MTTMGRGWGWDEVMKRRYWYWGLVNLYQPLKYDQSGVTLESYFDTPNRFN